MIGLQQCRPWKNLCSLLFPGRLRSRYFFCVMLLMVQGAHRGRPVAAAPCTPWLRPAKSPLRGAFDLSLQASGRAEAASVQNTALSPHPCGLPLPSGNVSAILRPPTPAVSVAQVGKLASDRTSRRPDRAKPPSGILCDKQNDRPGCEGYFPFRVAVSSAIRTITCTAFSIPSRVTNSCLP